MMHRAVVASFGRSLAGDPRPDDIVHRVTEDREREAFRAEALHDLAEARVYVLEDSAAIYADSFREEVQGDFSREAGERFADYMREIDLPTDIVWVEYNHRELVRSRLARGHVPGPRFNLDDLSFRAFLYDNRDPEHLKVRMFRVTGDGHLIDPPFHLRFAKDGAGRPDHRFTQPFIHSYMEELYRARGVPAAEIDEVILTETQEVGYDLSLGFMVFALIASRDDGVVFEPRETLSPKERKTAERSGKAWMSDALKTHIIIRIGPKGEAHLNEQRARVAHERAVAEGRSSPIEHWVSEHERRYRSGKIVMVRAHKRGRGGDDLVRRVVGPST